jgi:hypothetical protein
MLDLLLRNIEGKIDRAEHHLGTLEQIVEDGGVGDLIETRTDRDRQGRVRLRVKEIAEIPVDWNVLVGECVYNMRSALDHLAYGLNIIGSGKDPPPNERASQFPIYTNRETFYRGRGNIRRAEPMIRYFPHGTRTIVEGVQPYHGRKKDPVGPRRLEVLSELANIDKHRRFPIAAATTLGARVPLSIEGHRVTRRAEWGSYVLKRDATILRFNVPTLPASCKEPSMNFKLAIDVHLMGRRGEPPICLPWPSESLTFVLKSTLNFIQREVLPPLLPFILKR